MPPLNINDQKTHTISSPTKANDLFSTQTISHESKPNKLHFPTNSLNTSGWIGCAGNPHLHDAANTQQEPIILGRNGSPRPLSNTACLETQEMMLVIQNPSVLAQIVSESHGHLQQPYMDVGSPSATNELPTPGLSFFHIPTWETPLYIPMHQTHPMAATTPPPGYPNIQDINPCTITGKCRD